MARGVGDTSRTFRTCALAALAFAAPIALHAFDLTIGPLLEYDTDTGFTALRPLFSRAPGTATDVLWPIGTHHVESERRWWRAAICYGFYEDRYDMDALDTDVPRGSASSANVFPLWFSGVSRDGDSYWAAFPLYGRHPHLLLLDDFSFVLFPIYFEYSTPYRPEGGRGAEPAPVARSHAVLWPLVSWKESPRNSIGIWPFWGHATRRESEHSYVLWPIATWASYGEDRDTGGAGDSWMFWPFYGRIRRERERQDLYLPPFFSWAETPQGWRLRVPWPLVDLERMPARNRTSVWPFVERVQGFSFYERERVEEDSWRFGWKLVENSTLSTSHTREDVFSVFPFYAHEERFGSGGDCVSSYLRIWPFYERFDDGGRRFERVLALFPIRHAAGVDRNWAPFWTMWSRRDLPDGRTRHSAFFEFAVWHTGEKRGEGK